MRLTDFDLYSELIKERSGIVLSQEKSYLIESRLSPIATEWGFANLDAMTIELHGVPDPNLIDHIIAAITNNETSFFRNLQAFQTFKELSLPYLLEKRIHERGFKIWSAATSTGQEAYSLAMILKDHHSQFSHWKIDILGTDISSHVLKIAEKGEYSQFDSQRGLSIKDLLKYFTQKGEKWQISDQVKKMVRFQQFNLLDNMSNLGEFDVVFCNNVLMYFDDETKADILARISAQMKDDAFLYIGKQENIHVDSEHFAPIPGHKYVYAKKGSVHLKQAEKASLQAGA